jgi:hypothetical protein
MINCLGNSQHACVFWILVLCFVAIRAQEVAAIAWVVTVAYPGHHEYVGQHVRDTSGSVKSCAVVCWLVGPGSLQLRRGVISLVEASSGSVPHVEYGVGQFLGTGRY